MMRTRLALVALLAFGLVTSPGCGKSDTSTSGGGGTTTPTTSPAATLAGTSWQLTSYQGAARAVVPAASGATATLAFAANGVLSGSTGCNQFGGGYTLDGRQLTIQLGPMTQMACVDPLPQAQEAALVQLLLQVAGFNQTTDTLDLTGGDGAVLLTYAPRLAH